MKMHHIIRRIHDIMPLIIFRDFIFKRWLRKQPLEDKARAAILLVNVTERFCRMNFNKKVRLVAFTKIFGFLIDNMGMNNDLARKAAKAKIDDMNFDDIIKFIQED